MQRASGALFGLAYGDALGAPTEFDRLPGGRVRRCGIGPGGLGAAWD